MEHSNDQIETIEKFYFLLPLTVWTKMLHKTTNLGENIHDVMQKVHVDLM